MAKISALPLEASPDGSETVVLVKNNVTRRAALGGIVDAAAAPHVAAAQMARDQVVDMVEAQRIFVDLPLADAEGATNDGQFFKLVDSAEGIAEVRRRTATGSDLLYSEATTAALASVGATMIGTRSPYSGAEVRFQSDTNAERVSVTDFGSVISDAAGAFAKAFAAAAEYGRSVCIPKLDAGLKYAIQGDLQVPEGMRLSGAGSGSGSSRKEPGSVLEFEDGALLMKDAGGVTLDNLRIRRVGSIAGPAIDFAATITGTARNVLNDVSVIGSTGIGARFSGGWLFSWFNPYIRQCEIGILVEEGSFTTGMNSMSLFGGEIQSCATAGIVLDRCKQFNVVGTAIEGNGMGLGLGRSAAAVNILAYFEANAGGHIMPYSHDGGAAGVAQCVVIQGGTYIYKGSGPAVTAIDIPLCRQFHMQPGVWVNGYQALAEPLIHVKDVGDSNRAYGSIGGISVDCPADRVLQNDCISFGEETRRHFYLNAETPDDAASQIYKLPLIRGGAGRRNPSTIASIIFHLDVTTAGSVVLSAQRRDAAGATIGGTVNSTQTVTPGYNRLSVALQDTDDVAFIEVFRPGQTLPDTAAGVTIVDVEVITYENRVKVV